MAEVRAKSGVPLAADFAGLGAPTLCAPLVVDASTGKIYSQKSDGTVYAAGGGGTVTSVGGSFTGGLITVGGSPVTTSGTLALTVAGTSGGVPYFSSSSTWASSGALSSNQLILGGGAGSAPTSLAAGTSTTVLHGNATGAPTFSPVSLANDVTGNLGVSHLNSGTSAGATTYWRGDATWTNPLSGGITVTITTAALTGLGTQGSMTFTNGILTAQTAAT